jgi:hypothetical protein
MSLFLPEKVVLGCTTNLDSKFNLKPSLGNQSFFFFFPPFVMGVFEWRITKKKLKINQALDNPNTTGVTPPQRERRKPTMGLSQKTKQNKIKHNIIK